MRKNFGLFNLPLREVFFFAVPIVAGQFGQMLFGIGDIFVAGFFSSTAVSAIGVGSAIFSAFLMIGLGVLLCTGPLASQNKGAGESDTSLLYNVYMVCLINSFLLTTSIYTFSHFISFIGLNPEIEPHVVRFLQISAFTILPALIFQATKEYLQALGKTYFPNALVILFNLINLGLGFLFMFGVGSFSGFGITGIAIATFVCRTLMAVAVVIYMSSVCEFARVRSWAKIKRIYTLGLPISFTILCEVLIFTVVTVLVGRMSLIASAAQSLVINITSLTFMVPLGIGSAISVLVGEQFGRRSVDGIKKFSAAALTLALCTQIFFASVYFIFPNVVLGFFSRDQAVIHYGSQLLFWVGLFQLPDGIQVVLSGVMRGLNETKIPMLLGFMSYWIVGLPVGCYFAYTLNYEARGLWMGLSLGLLCMSILLVILFRRKLSGFSN
ncbi:MAG: MATE family efflux transporter [Bdellovibrio sp.]|nr:MATE family efflux transporter [Bdellovibrio sp.]